MPTYSYVCSDCEKKFELFFYIKDYISSPECIRCKNNNTYRRYVDDCITQNYSVKKSDSELKTVGDLADRNRDKMTDQQKMDLYIKHNEYKEETDTQKDLPSGMSRLKKPKKPIWPGSKAKKRRSYKK